MSRLNDRETASNQALEPDTTEHTAEHQSTGLNKKSGRKVPGKRAALSKADARFWLPRLFKWEDSPNYSIRIQFRGRRVAFTLGTGNKDAAARRAAGIYNNLLTLGIDVTLSRHRAQGPEVPAAAASVGQWIEAAHRVFDGKPATFAAYARSLRAIAADIATVQRQRHSRERVLQFRRQIDAAPLSILTPEAIQAWRIRFVQRKGGNPARQRSARISANSIIRQARSLFAKKHRKFIHGLLLPDPLPFADIEFYPRESMRYQSKIDPVVLLCRAQESLAGDDPESFKILILALGAGLRRGEIDRLLWRQVDCNAGVIHVEATEAGDLKSADSAGEVAIDETLCEILQGFKARASSQFVIEGPDVEKANSRAWGHAYRCTSKFEKLSFWLRANGVEGNKPLHTLRKESGSIIATKAGIYAASKFLRHADIGVTAAHYTDHKERVTVDMGALLAPTKVASLPSPFTATPKQPALPPKIKHLQ
jgi:integrase